MQCPRCHHNDTRVVDSRPTAEGQAIRRRRECEKCGFRFTTFERVEVAPLLVIKKDVNLEEFSLENILRGIISSAEKRPVTMQQIKTVVDKDESMVLELGENEISSQLIGEYVMNELADVDEIAYIRFASVYRQFKDMSVFLDEMKEMVERDKRSDKR